MLISESKNSLINNIISDIGIVVIYGGKDEDRDPPRLYGSQSDLFMR